MCKTCSKCGELKPKSEFYKDSKNKDGYQGHCKKCRNEKIAQYKSGKRAQELRSRYRKSDAYKDACLNSTLKKRYGITSAQYAEMLQEQGGMCAICGNPDALQRRLAVDHCHVTGKVRGLLCTECNLALGKFKDSQAVLSNAIKYLKEHQQ